MKHQWSGGEAPTRPITWGMYHRQHLLPWFLAGQTTILQLVVRLTQIVQWGLTSTQDHPRLRFRGARARTMQRRKQPFQYLWKPSKTRTPTSTDVGWGTGYAHMVKNAQRADSAMERLLYLGGIPPLSKCAPP